MIKESNKIYFDIPYISKAIGIQENILYEKITPEFVEKISQSNWGIEFQYDNGSFRILSNHLPTLLRALNLNARIKNDIHIVFSWVREGGKLIGISPLSIKITFSSLLNDQILKPLSNAGFKKIRSTDFETEMVFDNIEIKNVWGKIGEVVELGSPESPTQVYPNAFQSNISFQWLLNEFAISSFQHYIKVVNRYEIIKK